MSPEKKIFQDRYLVLLKNDVMELYERIVERQDEYIEFFSLHREREGFKEVFRNRFSEATMFDLSHLPVEVIELSHDFYKVIDDIYWYIMHTQDMPNTIQDTLVKRLGPLKKKYQNLIFYIDASLSNRTE